MASAKVDKITQSLVDEFSSANGLGQLSAAEKFERFVNFSVVSGEHSDTFDVEDVSGPGDEVGIDGLAVLVNGALVATGEEVAELAQRNRHIEATFVLVSSKRSGHFSEAEAGNLGLAAYDFFTEAKFPRTDFIERCLEVKDVVYENGARFSKGLPRLRLYYVTTGRWDAPDVIARRFETEVDRLQKLDLFGQVEMVPVGAQELRELYFKTQNPVSAEFTFSQRVTLPTIPGISQAYLGVVPATEYVQLIADEAGQIRKSLFTDNVRDYRGDDNDVNAGIAETLRSAEKNRFAVLNNGVTVVARELRVTGDKLYMESYQIVNGGQTSHVLFNAQDDLDETVFVPIRVIGTDDEDLTTAVITATNSQTPVAAQELNSRSQFERDLERFFNAYGGAQALYYERRSKQYAHVGDIEKVRIVTRDQLVRSFAAIWLDEPHRATGYVPALMEQLGGRIMGADHRHELYYAAAFANYKLEFFWRNRQIDSASKPGRWQILMVARHLAVDATVGFLNSREAAKRADDFRDQLWDDKRSLELFKEAIELVDGGVSGNWRRDHMRNQPTTQDVLSVLAG